MSSVAAEMFTAARCDRRRASPTKDADAVAKGELHPLVERARAGDTDAWEALYRRSYPRLLAYAGRRLPTTDLARDAVAEAVTRAVAGIERFRGEGAGFDAWMYGILRHVVVDMQRHSVREGPGVVPDTPDLAAGPGDTVLGNEETVHLRAAFARLNPDDREVLELRVVAGLSSEEVATALGRRPGAVRMAQSRALARLRSLLEEDEREACVVVT